MTMPVFDQYYDPEADIMYIKFSSEGSTKGIQLTENIVLRLDPISGEVMGVIVHNYTPIAVQGLADPLTGLPTTDMTLRRALASKPFSDFLVLSRHSVSLGPALMPQPLAQAA